MNDEINDFYKAYRDYLDQQRDKDLQDLENARRNQFQNIMGAANAAGMMYSNFPKRSKYQYDTSVYMPGREKIKSTYQTGLDKLRSNIIDTLNSIADYNDEIASLNKQYANNGLPSGAVKLNDAGDYVIQSLVDGTQFKNASGDSIKLGTALKRAGLQSNEDILRGAEAVLSNDDMARLMRIYRAQQGTKNPNIIYNVGENYFEPAYSFLSDEDNAFLGRLGLGLGS